MIVMLYLANYIHKLYNKEMRYLINILVLEDEASVNRGITFSLEKVGYEVFSCATISEAKRLVKEQLIEILICDINLPDGNGLEFISWVRSRKNIYIICLTALDQEIDQVLGYEAGADDYVTKPFSLSVLLLKIDAYCKRTIKSIKNKEMISGNIYIYKDEMKIRVNEEIISLTKKEWRMLTLFLAHPKQILSKNQILENVFDIDGEYVDENTVAVNIRRLREKIKDNSTKPEYLKNVRGLGYVWDKEVRWHYGE